MSRYQYHQVMPENVKNSYGEFDNVDFVLTFQNRKIVCNSIRLEGDFVPAPASGDLRHDNTNTQLIYDGMVGSHAFIDQVQTEFQSMGVVENLQSYARYVKMKAGAMLTEDDLFSSRAVCEMRVGQQQATNCLLRGPQTGVLDSNVYDADKFARNDLDFSMKPSICLNNASSKNGVPHLSYRKTGAIRLSIRLARNSNVLFGSDAQNGTALHTASYTLKNLKVCFISVNDDGRVPKQAPVFLKTKMSIKQSVASSFVNLATKVPAVCNAVSCSFLKQSAENQVVPNTLQTEKPPDITQVQFMFNDSTNEYISFIMKTEVEMLDRYLESFKDIDSNDASLVKLKANKSYGIGLDFGAGQYIDLSNQKFNIQIQSAISSSDPYVMFCYFHSIISL